MTDEMFGPYQLIKLIGRGGMGEVYRAYDTRRQRTVALKRLIRQMANDEDFKKRFERESQLAARLSSPHVIPIHDFGVIDGHLFLDMRLVDGQDLAALVAAEGSLDPGRSVDLVEQLADALDAAHADGLVHRDVKPSNALITSHRDRDFVYLVDFGIVRVMGGAAGTSLTATGSAIGTMAYMAPELFTGTTIDRRVDVYALGCLLYETLTGQPPFVGEGPALMYQHISAPPPSLSVTRPGLPVPLDAVITRAMAKDPAHRYPTAGDLADAARTAIGGRPVTQPRGPGTPGGTFPDTGGQGRPGGGSGPVPPQPETRLPSGPFPRGPLPPGPPRTPDPAPPPPRRRSVAAWVALTVVGTVVVVIAALIAITSTIQSEGHPQPPSQPEVPSQPPSQPEVPSQAASQAVAAKLAPVFPDFQDPSVTCKPYTPEPGYQVVTPKGVKPDVMALCAYPETTAATFYTKWPTTTDAQEYINYHRDLNSSGTLTSSTTWAFTGKNKVQGPFANFKTGIPEKKYHMLRGYTEKSYVFDMVANSSADLSSLVQRVKLNDVDKIPQ